MKIDDLEKIKKLIASRNTARRNIEVLKSAELPTLIRVALKNGHGHNINISSRIRVLLSSALIVEETAKIATTDAELARLGVFADD